MSKFEWKPIETAPLDTPVLVAWREKSGGWVWTYDYVCETDDSREADENPEATHWCRVYVPPFPEPLPPPDKEQP